MLLNKIVIVLIGGNDTLGNTSIDETFSNLEAIIDEMPGWNETTAGVTDYNKLPENAKNYIKKIEQLVGINISIISTGPDRDETIILEHPFA